MKLLLGFWSRDTRAAAWVVGLFVIATLGQVLGGAGAVYIAVAGDADLLWRMLKLAIALVSLIGFYFASREGFRRWMQLTEQACDSLVLRLAERIEQAELRDIERVGAEELLSTITRETANLLDISWMAISCLFSIANLVVRVIYIVSVSLPMAGVLALVAIAATPVMRSMQATQARRESLAAAADGRFLRFSEQMITGFTWFKLDARRRADMVRRHLLPQLDAARRADIGAGRAFAAASAIVDVLIVLGIGSVIFLVPPTGSHAQSVVIGTLLLTSWAHVADVMTLFPSFFAAEGSLRRLGELEASLIPSEPAPPTLPPNFDSMVCEGMVFEHTNASGEVLFRLGPIDMTINRGEIVFVVGGNGGGKSTLIKLLCGLYRPIAGTIRVDGVEIAPTSQRSLFGGVFSDFTLFERLYGLQDIDEAAAAGLLEKFGLARVTVLRNGRFSTRDLSTGQRKRLALVVTVLENRPIMLFDEWAADQDPEFREYFYRHILPEQRARGATIIAVTHDDRYFDCADRIIEVEDGRILAQAAVAAA